MASVKLIVHLNQETGAYDLKGTNTQIKTPFWGKILGVGPKKAIIDGKETIYYAVILDLFNAGVPVLMNFGEVAFGRFTLGMAGALKNGDISPDSDPRERYIIFDSGYDVVAVMGGVKLLKLPRMRFQDKAPGRDEKVYPEIAGITALKAGLAALPSLEDAGLDLPELMPGTTSTVSVSVEEIPEAEEFDESGA